MMVIINPDLALMETWIPTTFDVKNEPVSFGFSHEAIHWPSYLVIQFQFWEGNYGYIHPVEFRLLQANVPFLQVNEPIIIPVFRCWTNLFVYIHVYIYIHIYICILYICIYTHVYIYIFIYLFSFCIIYLFIFLYMRVWTMYVCMYVCMYVYI